MTCSTDIVEVGGVRVAHSGSSSLSFSTTLRGATTIQIDLIGNYSPSLLFFSIVRIFPPNDPLGTPLFFGIVQNVSYVEKLNQSITRISCIDMSIMLSWRHVHGEFVGSPQSILDSVLALGNYPWGGAVSSSYSAYSLRFAFSGVKVNEAIEQIVGQLPRATWFVSPSFGMLSIIDQSESTPSATIQRPTLSLQCGDELNRWDVQTNMGSAECNRTTVFGRNARHYDGQGFIIQNTSYDIIPNSVNKLFPLLEDTTAVLEVEMTEAASVGDFTISISPASQYTAPADGDFTWFTVTITPIDGFTGDVDLTSADAHFVPATVVGGSGTSLMYIDAAGFPNGTHEITATGTSGALVHSDTCDIIVNANYLIMVYNEIAQDSYSVTFGPYDADLTHTHELGVNMLSSEALSVVITPSHLFIPKPGVTELGYPTSGDPHTYGFDYAAQGAPMGGNALINGSNHQIYESTVLSPGEEVADLNVTWNNFLSLNNLGGGYTRRHQGRIKRVRRVLEYNGSSFDFVEQTTVSDETWDILG